MTGEPVDFAGLCTEFGLEPVAPLDTTSRALYCGARATAGGVVQEWDIAGAELRVLWPLLGPDR